MARLEFEDIKFSQEKSKPGVVVVTFMRLFETQIGIAPLLKIGDFAVGNGALEFPGVSDAAAQHKFMLLLNNAFSTLKNKLTGRKTVYVHRNSGIPLIGSIYFGMVDRGTNILEIKPITGCNISCVFCSVNEGAERKCVDFVVEDDYLAQEVKRVVEFKQQDGGKKIDIFINTHGEPLLYAPMARLVKSLRAMKEVGTISIITNGTLLTKPLLDSLIEAGLNQLNISINAFDREKANELAGTKSYDIEHVKDIARYASKKLKLVIAPVWIKGMNDEEMPKLIAFAKEAGADIGIQNYLVHKMGRKIAKELPREEFYAQLEEWEKVTGAKLKADSHTLFATKPLEKPFRKGDTVKAELVCPGRMKDEMLAAAKGRVISIIGCSKERGTVKAHIVKDKDNIFIAEEVK
jgi:uncharacterized Fe-S cluster-containing radical SAM superfamily enzyme